MRIPVGVEGSLLLRNGALVFDPDQIEALGLPVPKRLTQGLLRGADFSYPIDEESPFELTFSGVELHKGRLVLHGEVGSLPLEPDRERRLIARGSVGVFAVAAGALGGGAPRGLGVVGNSHSKSPLTGGMPFVLAGVGPRLPRSGE